MAERKRNGNGNGNGSTGIEIEESHQASDQTDQDNDELVVNLPPRGDDNSTASGYSVSLEELDQYQVDTELKEREYQQMNPPRGDWLKEDQWEYDKDNGAYCKVGDCQTGDLNPNGRMFVTVKGHCKPRTEAGFSHDPEFSARLSFDKRMVVNDEGKESPDMATRLYQEAREVYLAIHGKAMDRNPSTLIKFLVQDHFTIQHMKGDTGCLVTKIKRTRNRR